MENRENDEFENAPATGDELASPGAMSPRGYWRETRSSLGSARGVLDLKEELHHQRRGRHRRCTRSRRAIYHRG